ncbi:MAG: hypothetical protein SD837_22105 [Candidatus Electrothrix scaldis]|nr:MAG: hypothetical protein SD837_22105 [Candidatus Electrothrix sp. GW3-3]
MALQITEGFPGNGMTHHALTKKYSKDIPYDRVEKKLVNRNLLFDIAAVTNRYSKDAIGLLVSRMEVFESSLYCCGTKKFFNDALVALKEEGFITLTPFTVALTPSGFDCIHDI